MFCSSLFGVPVDKEFHPLSNVELLEFFVGKEPECSEFVRVPFFISLKNGMEAVEHLCKGKAMKRAEENFTAFCQRVEKSSQVKEYSIPPIIHIIWLGSPPPRGVQLVIDSWRKYHPDWEIRVWRDQDLEGFVWSFSRSKKYYEMAKSWAEKVDILRLEVLYQYGGIYVDADFVCLKPFDDLVTNDLSFFAGFVGPRGKQFGVGDALIGSTIGHSILKRSIEESKTKEEAPGQLLCNRGGPGALTRACYETLLRDDDKSIVFFPCTYLFPLPLKKRSIRSIEELDMFIKPESYAVHLWEGSWW